MIHFPPATKNLCGMISWKWEKNMRLPKTSACFPLQRRSHQCVQHFPSSKKTLNQFLTASKGTCTRTWVQHFPSAKPVVPKSCAGSPVSREKPMRNLSAAKTFGATNVCNLPPAIPLCTTNLIKQITGSENVPAQ